MEQTINRESDQHRPICPFGKKGHQKCLNNFSIQKLWVGVDQSSQIMQYHDHTNYDKEKLFSSRQRMIKYWASPHHGEIEDERIEREAINRHMILTEDLPVTSVSMQTIQQSKGQYSSIKPLVNPNKRKEDTMSWPIRTYKEQGTHHTIYVYIYTYILAGVEKIRTNLRKSKEVQT